ncbi:MFS transporter [Georgenia sp. AZ-5]|uniref:MFS transporter n=1 Tax=Georgenia sp. AZ-5 TaxID=3367526 RepID=UPI0037541E90
MVVLSQVGTTTAVVVAGALVGAGFGTLMPAAQAAVVRIADGRRVGLAVSTYYLFLDLGTGLGPLALGLVIGAGDHRVMYLAVAGLVLASAGHYHALHGRRARLAVRG